MPGNIRTVPYQGVDLRGRVFGKLTVIQLGFDDGITKWLCRCVCGTEKLIRTFSLYRGLSVSCGCHRRTMDRSGQGLRHGLSNSGTYKSWVSMRTRCGSSNAPNFHLYGGRGIRVCERWNLFDNFLADMGERPAGTTLDRIDNNGNYEPGNCRWATNAEQARNKRTNRRLTAFGETKPIEDWLDDPRCVATRQCLHKRFARGWDNELSITTRSMGSNRERAERASILNPLRRVR